MMQVSYMNEGPHLYGLHVSLLTQTSGLKGAALLKGGKPQDCFTNGTAQWLLQTRNGQKQPLLEVILKDNNEGNTPGGGDVSVPLVVHCPRKEKWLKLWIYMDSWAATWKEPDWKIKDKDTWGRSIGMGLWEWARSMQFFSFFKKVFVWLCWVLVGAHEIFSCGIWDLVPSPGTEP